MIQGETKEETETNVQHKEMLARTDTPLSHKTPQTALH